MNNQSNHLPTSDLARAEASLPRTKVRLEFQSDPGKYYVFLLVLHSGFSSISDVTSYLKTRNPSLVPVLNSLLVEMEKAHIIRIEGDLYEASLKGIELEIDFADIDMLSDFSRITIQAAAKSHEGFQFGISTQKTAGFRNLAIPYNRRTVSRLNMICAKFQADLCALIDECGEAERPEYMYVSLSRSLLQPEDFE